ncbi:MAG: NAD(P)/FAD-dependent oxidoreductase [Bacteroidota bacterium]
MVNMYDVIIVGGGLAGLTAALHLAQKNHDVLVFEKQSYPHHKVCGEYVSNEIIAYLDSLGISLSSAGAVSIDTLQLTTVSGKSLHVKLPLGGTGISRFAFDELLYKKALALDIPFVFQSVHNVTYKNDVFTVTGNNTSYTSRIVIGAYGKRDYLDKQLNRSFIQRKSSWLGVKAHYRYDDFPKNLVALHNFRGGYGGLSMTETGAINFCYLTSYDSFKQEKDITNFNAKIVKKNPFLRSFLERAEPLFDKPLSIAQVSFHQKNTVENHVIMCGDTAGLIHPLSGNGMAMAVHSAKIACEHIHYYFNAGGKDRHRLEDEYSKGWNIAFKKRLQMGRRLQSILLNQNLSTIAIDSVAKSPWLLRSLIRKTHGKPLI